VNCPAHQYYPAYIALATPATEQPGGEDYRAGVAAGLEKAAGIASADALTMQADAKLWRADRMNMAGDAAEQQGLAGVRIAAAIRQEIGNG
jgi:hypothetical protein